MAEDNNAGGPPRNFGIDNADESFDNPNDAFLPADHVSTYLSLIFFSLATHAKTVRCSSQRSDRESRKS